MTTTQISSAVRNLPKLSIDLVKAAKFSEGFLGNLDEEVVQQLELQYRQWLSLKAKYPAHSLAPTRGIDEMWHLHMLHPKAYVKDSMAIFGFILDHNPGLGKEVGTLSILLSRFADTSALWEKEFGQPYSVSDSTIQAVVMCSDDDSGDEELVSDDPNPGEPEEVVPDESNPGEPEEAVPDELS
jgi:hypothetical protein